MTYHYYIPGNSTINADSALKTQSEYKDEYVFDSNKSITFVIKRPRPCTGITIDKPRTDVLLEFLAERYADIITESGVEKDIEVTINTDTGEKTYSAFKVVEEINENFKKMTIRYITKTNNIPIPKISGDSITGYAIPVNAKLLFKPLLYTYWRLATYMVSLYTWSSPYDSIGMYKFPNRFIVKLFDKETSEGKIRIRPSPNPSNNFFYYLFPGNGGPPRVSDIKNN